MDNVLSIATERTAQHARRKNAALRGFRDHLEMEGFGAVAGADLLAALGDLDIEPLVREAQKVVADGKASAEMRPRHYSAGILFPWAPDQLVYVPPVTGADGRQASVYYQSADFNADAAGKERYFEPLSEELRASPVMTALVKLMWSLIPQWRLPNGGRTPLQFGVHLIGMLSPDGRRASVGTPNECHVDGEQFTFISSITRENVIGGENIVATRDSADLQADEIPPEKLLYRATLEDLLDTVAVDDARVSHLVTAVLAKTLGTSGFRVSLLIDFVQLIQMRTPPAHG